MNINQTALNIHFGFLWGLCSLKECIQFSDQMIAQKDTVPYEIIALSLSKSNQEAIEAIKPLIHNTDTNEAIRCALGRMYSLGLHEPGSLFKFASLLYFYGIENDHLELDGFNLCSFEYEYEISDVLGGTNENVDQEFMGALSLFKRENSNRSDWFVSP
jgi:hypothetical protein